MVFFGNRVAKKAAIPNLCTSLPFDPMHMKCISFVVLMVAILGNVAGQDKKAQSGDKAGNRIGVARIQIFAAPGKGRSLADIANNNVPVFFGENSDFIKYRAQGLLNQAPPTTGDSIQELTSDSLAVYFKRDLWSMSGYDDVGGNSRGKRNMIHDLPTENPQKLAVDSIFDEAIDIACQWTFTDNADKTAYIVSVTMKMEIYDRSGQARPERKVTLEPQEIKTAHFKAAYNVDYDFAKGIPVKEVEKGGILGNVIADVYLQALNKLLAKRI
jgi:hypothetical protein